MNKEIWRDVKGYEGLYQVSDQGRAKSLERKDRFGRTVKERILKPAVTQDGYLKVTLWAGGKPKTLRVHRLVCEAFYDNPDNKSDVNHINEDKTDNRACNLEWCTRRENNNHGTHNEPQEKLEVSQLRNVQRRASWSKLGHPLLKSENKQVSVKAA